nr:MAG TPA: anaerobic ribonucleoside-triphosphate reductase activating protein [Caudoviricetes sp.]
MRYSQIRSMDISNGEGIGIALFTTGCRFYCKNCFNKELWDVNNGEEWNPEIEDKFISLAQPDYITRISILGGEPFIDENLIDLKKMIKKIKGIYPNKNIWVYSGYYYEELIERAKDIFPYIDVLVDGRYIDELKNPKLKFRGSSNQRVIDVQKSLKENKIILWCD